MMDDSDSLVQCPYNPSHILYRSRLQTHLVKCKRAHENPQQNVEPKIMKVCRFNSNHHVLAAELDQHYLQCPDIATVLNFTNRQGNGSVVPYNPIELPPTDENWDNEEYNSTYNPEHHATSSVIIRQMQGVPKSVRKHFRMQERERINRLREDQEALVKSARIKLQQPKAVEVENTAFSVNRLRQPRSGLLGMGRGRILQGGPVQNKQNLGQGVYYEMQDIPTMLALATVNGTSSSHRVSNGVNSPPNGMCSPNGGTSISDVRSSNGTDDSQSTCSPDEMFESKTNSLGNTLSNSCAAMMSDMNVDSEGFVQQISKKNKKKQALRGIVPPGSRPVANPLLSGHGSLKLALPGQPGKGRGRLSEFQK